MYNDVNAVSSNRERNSSISVDNVTATTMVNIFSGYWALGGVGILDWAHGLQEALVNCGV